MTRGPARGFSLAEVLIALALAALVLGAVLRTAGLQTVRIRKATPRYQLLLRSSAMLESRVEDGFTGTESGEQDGVEYRVSTSTVPADPRIEEIRVETAWRGLHESLAVYRLRARRQEEPPPLPEAPGAPGTGAAPAPEEAAP